jgi:hypothetical protein
LLDVDTQVVVSDLDAGSATIVSEFICLVQKCPLVDLEDTKERDTTSI